MGIENLTLTFDNHAGVFYAGQVVSGRIQFVCTEPYVSDGVFVKFSGMAEVYWSEQHSSGRRESRRTYTVDYHSKQTYLDQLIRLYDPPGRQLQPDSYSLPFSFQLPLHLPSSYTGTDGMITYLVRAHVHRAGIHLATEVTLPFSVVGIKDLNDFPQLQHPLSVENHKKFGVLFWKSKPLSAQISINKQAFVSGENILVSGLIRNESNTKITQCDLKLIKLVQYHAQRLDPRIAGYEQFHAKEKTRSDKQTVYKCSQPGIGKESEVTWQNVPVYVPSLPPSLLDGCDIIDIQYLLEVRIVPSGLSSALKLTFNVIIGTIPFHQRAPPSIPTAGYAALPPSGSSTPGPSGVTPVPEKPSTPGSSNIPSDPSASSAPPAPPPYGGVQPTFGVYCGDSNEPPAYDSLFKGAEDNDEHDDVSRNYQPKYPSFNIPHQ